jgi:nucleoside-diphosphate-sugar epimerase
MFPPEDYAIPKGSTVLVTGANGYLASHVVDILLEIGFKVRGTVRTRKPWLDKMFEERHGPRQYQSIMIPDLAAEGAYTQAMRGVAAVVHMVCRRSKPHCKPKIDHPKASDVSLRTDPETVIGGAIDSAVNILTAAAKESSIKRFVLTSSSSAAYLPTPNSKNVIIDESKKAEFPYAIYVSLTSVINPRLQTRTTTPLSI